VPPPPVRPAVAPPVPPAVDWEDPTSAHPARVVASDVNETAHELKKTPGTGFSLFGGYDFVGQIFGAPSVPAQRTSVGRGTVAGLSGIWTPLWFGNTTGLGAQIEAGFKYANFDNPYGRISVRGFPLALTGHLLTNFNGRSRNYLIARVGVAHEVGINYHYDTFDLHMDAAARGTWGWTFGIGYYRTFTPTLAGQVLWSLIANEHVMGDSRASANCAALTFAVHLNL